MPSAETLSAEGIPLFCDSKKQPEYKKTAKSFSENGFCFVSYDETFQSFRTEGKHTRKKSTVGQVDRRLQIGTGSQKEKY
jgi:hypothetical protein